MNPIVGVITNGVLFAAYGMLWRYFSVIMTDRVKNAELRTEELARQVGGLETQINTLRARAGNREARVEKLEKRLMEVVCVMKSAGLLEQEGDLRSETLVRQTSLERIMNDPTE